MRVLLIEATSICFYRLSPSLHALLLRRAVPGTTTTQPRRLLSSIDDRTTPVYYLLLQPMHKYHMPAREEAALWPRVTGLLARYHQAAMLDQAP